jgi:hypothetical protein
MIRGFSLALFFASVTGLALSAGAAAAAPQFDPFNPSPQAQVAAVSLGAVVPASSSIVVPSAIKPASSPVNPKIIYISVNNAPEVAESPTKSTISHFTVTLSQASTESVTFHYETSNGSAVSGVDYDFSSGWLTFKPGQTSITVNVTVLPSLPAIPRIKDFLLNLYTDPTSHGTRPPPVTGATIARGTATGLIDTGVAKQPTIYISVGNAPAVQQSKTAKTLAHFAVRLSQASTNPVSFHYATVNGTATANEDFVYKSGWLAFKPGQTVIYLDVTVLPEPAEKGEYKTESFALDIASVTDAMVTQASGQATILGSK